MLPAKQLCTLAAVALMFAPLPGSAEIGKERPARCELQIGKTVYIDGPCGFEPTSDDGSFIIRGPQDRFFAYVVVTRKNHADGYWNGPASGAHAHDPLGELVRQGACWVNASARVCAY